MSEKIEPNLPHGINYEYWGVKGNDREIVPSIIIVLTVAAFIIFFFLLINFKKIDVALTALISLSLVLPGTVFGLSFTNTPIGLTCILGIISLFGITIRNTILIFDHAEDLRKNKRKTAKEAALEAGKRRMVPIFLTSATTAIGIIPMIVANTSLWAPMGIVIFFGTIFSMILVVMSLPVIYWKIFQKVKIANLAEAARQKAKEVKQRKLINKF